MGLNCLILDKVVLARILPRNISWIISFWHTGFFLLVKIHYICKQMDVIYIFACLMQLDYVLTHTPEGIFKKKEKYDIP